MTRLLLAAISLVGIACAQPYSGVLTYHNDNLRTGWNSRETILTTSTVSNLSFGKLFSCPVDGYIYGQPLYVYQVTTPSGTHNLAIVATENDSVYAFDADTGSPLWVTSLLLPGSTAVPARTVGSNQIVPVIGITSTPVIDANTGFLYAVAESQISNGTVSQRIWMLDVRSGTVWANQLLAASYPGTAMPQVNGMVAYDPLKANQRPALLLLNGIVYVASASHGDRGPYHGWLLGFNASSLTPMFVWNSTPNGVNLGGAGGIWMAGNGPTSNGTNIYLATGNGDFTANVGGSDYGDSMVIIGQDGTVHNYFTPSNELMLKDDDWDFGSGGVMLIPGKNLAVAAGKFGTIYLMDTDNPGGFDPSQDHTIDVEPGFQPILATPTYYNDGVSDWVFYGPRGFKLINEKLVAQFPGKHSGVNASISSNGPSPGILWMIKSGSNQNTPAILQALTANDAKHQKTLYSSSNARDVGGLYVKFTLPTVVNGKVYVGTQTELDVFGLLFH